MSNKHETMFEAVYKYNDEDVFLSAHVMEVAVTRRGILPGATRETISVQDPDLGECVTSPDLFFETEAQAWSSLVTELTAMIMDSDKTIARLIAERETMKRYRDNAQDRSREAAHKSKEAAQMSVTGKLRADNLISTKYGIGDAFWIGVNGEPIRVTIDAIRIHVEDGLTVTYRIRGIWRVEDVVDGMPRTLEDCEAECKG